MHTTNIERNSEETSSIYREGACELERALLDETNQGLAQALAETEGRTLAAIQEENDMLSEYELNKWAEQYEREQRADHHTEIS